MKKQLLLLVMILAFANIPNYAQTVVNVNGLRFQIENGNAIVGRQDRELSGDIVIPSSIDYEGQTYSVTGIVGPIDTHSYGGMSSISADEAAFQGTAITSVTLPTTITNINTCAFINCSYLQKVVLPEGITSIGWGAFAYCSSLTEINLPNSLQSLSAWSFGGCSSLKSINIPENITNLPDAVFKNCGFESFDIPAQITRLGRESLNMYGLKSVKSYIRDITRIYYHDECFGNVTDKTLYIPNGSRFIYQEYNPWRKFATIEEFDDGHTGEPINPIELIATVNDIRYKIFDDGTAILIQQNESLSGEIVIPETITVGEKSYTVNGIIGPNDTHSWGNMNSISADGAAFQGTAITSITLPTTISNINTCAFINCSKLQKVVLPETITSIGWGAFAYCSSLTEINLPNSLQSLSAWAFAGCRELKQIAIPKQITTLPSACFKESGLNYIDIPENVVSMQNLCLNTSSLSYVKIYQSDINLIWTSDNAFGTYDNIQNTDLFVPRGCKTNYIQTYPWAKFRSIDEFGFIVNIDNNDGGKITASKTIVLYNDEKIRLTISPNTGYSLESLSINGIDVTKDIVNGEYIVSDINEDLNIVGVFIINKYKLTYTVDGEEYKSSEVEYGATITAEEAPTKEGYTFSGWSEIPETMPAHDVTVTGSFNINSYKLTYMIDEKVYKETMYEYGATITPEPAPDGDFVNFEWIELPETMPAHDVIVTGTYEKAFIPGDANGDGLVNVTDIVSTVNYIMENPSDNFNKDAADLNGDGIVNVTDIVQMVNIIMNGNGASSRRAAATSSNLIISGNNIQLRNAETYTAAQFDINLSDGQSISNIVLNCSSNHSLSWKMIDAKTCRVVAYSMTNATFCVNSDNLFDISLSGDQDVTISNELLVEADGTTGIDVIRREAENGNIYDLNGRQVKNPRKGLYIINGRKVIVK